MPGAHNQNDPKPARERVDRLLVARGVFESRAQAQAAIAAGLVRADGRTVQRASDAIRVEAEIIAEKPHPWVSRGGVKLGAALAHFAFEPRGRVCLDVGASTGGFTQVLLSRFARRVYAVDVGTGQLHSSLRGREDVVAFEQTDIRTFDLSKMPERPDLVVIDVSFISLKLVLPAIFALTAASAEMVALIKPQFEAGRDAIKKGVVRDAAVHAAICEDIAEFIERHGWRVEGVIPSPIQGGDGNREFLLGATTRR